MNETVGAYRDISKETKKVQSSVGSYKQAQHAHQLFAQGVDLGAVLVGKLVTGSLAYDDIRFGGRTRNPWNIEEYTTGSSAGPAACTSADITKLTVGYLEDAEMEVVDVLKSKGVKMVLFKLNYTVKSAQGILNVTMDVDMVAHFDTWPTDDEYEAQDQWPTELRRAHSTWKADSTSEGEFHSRCVCVGNLVGMPADTDRDGSISYNEFITAMMNIRREHKEEHLREAFNSFDKDGNGLISKEELKLALQKHKMGDEANIISEFDANDVGEITYEELCDMIRS
ncbi:outer envelope protein 64 chloroplastic [Tanacetum coccineum]|uniref:Outer envelope protein 64 chloroplastic n=1 Tax=Tanacetum coccineum TaxID=301880 RepID=A0ABQ5EXH8_9ASTR